MDICIYCGSLAQTNDHVPPKCFLEKPLPHNLSTVSACLSCNQFFSRHEQYAIALLAQIGSSFSLTAKVSEDGEVDRAFKRRPAFEQRFIDRMKVDESGRIYVEPETERVDLVLRKIVAGLYWLRYAKEACIAELGPIGFWPYNLENRVPPQAFLVAYTERFQPKRWSIVQSDVFEYMFAKDDNEQLCCVINWHNTLWITCIVPRLGHKKQRKL